MGLFKRTAKGKGGRPAAEAPAPEPAAAVAAETRSPVQAAVAERHPDAEPRTLEVRAMPDRPFEGAVHAYPAGDHGLLVTDGLAGHGWPELSLRVSVDDLIGLPPAVPWPFQVLVFLANSALTSGRGFAPETRLANDAPFNGDDEAAARCLLFVPDPELAGEPAEVPQFLQAVPVTKAELDTAAEEGTDAVTGQLAEANPLLVARLYR